MRNLALAAASGDGNLPDAYYRLFRIWLLFDIPGAALRLIGQKIGQPPRIGTIFPLSSNA